MSAPISLITGFFESGLQDRLHIILRHICHLPHRPHGICRAASQRRKRFYRFPFHCRHSSMPEAARSCSCRSFCSKASSRLNLSFSSRIIFCAVFCRSQALWKGFYIIGKNRKPKLIRRDSRENPREPPQVYPVYAQKAM